MLVFKKQRVSLVVSALVLGVSAAASAGDVFNLPAGQKSVEFVPVGDVGNAADTNGYGAVNYAYQFGKYHVTSAQYCAFLNAVAASDPYGLYQTNMAPGHTAACGITQNRVSNSFTYSVTAGYENFPVNYMSWAGAARFVNWLNNGQPNLAEGAGSTETGAYTLNGTTNVTNLNAVVRNPGLRYYLPTEDEQYKALYYKGGSTNAGYWSYATRNSAAPGNALSTNATNNANYKVGSSNTDPVHLLTPVGAFTSTVGPYGEYDPCGNVWQWNEALISVSGFIVAGDRGGGFNDSAGFIISSFRNARNRRVDANYDIGFRIDELTPTAALLNPAPGWSNGVFAFTLSAAVGQRWDIQGSTDLSNWTPLGTLVLSNTPALFIDSQASNFDGRFYRAVSP